MATKKETTTPAKYSTAKSKPASQSKKVTSKAPKSQPRTIKVPRYKSFALQKPIKYNGPDLPSAFKIFKASVGILKRNWKPFLGIALLYGMVNIVVVQGLTTGSNVTEAKTAFEGMFHGGIGHVAAGTASFFYLVGLSGTSATSTAGSYQLIWMLIISLAIIWSLRQVHSDKEVRVRDGFYKGMHPLVPFVFVLAIIAIQLSPMIIASSLFTTIMTNGIASSFFEASIWGGLFFLMTLLSLYMISSSIFALYIVSLPDMTPRVALRSARQLVAGRRWTVMRKVLYLPFILLLLGALVMVPIILLLPATASWLLFALLMICMPLMHSYLYSLYRALL